MSQARAAAATPATGELGPDQARFIEDAGALFRSLGSHRDVGRVYAYFLIKSMPATLDDLESALQISKSAASSATRILERSGMLVRSRTPGSRRKVYHMEGSPAVIFAGLLETMRATERLVSRALPLADGDDARARARFLVDHVRRYVEMVESFLKPGVESDDQLEDVT